MYDYVDYGYYSEMGVLPLIISLVIGAVAIISLWRIFTKAGKPGWASLIPFYNFYVLFEITWGKGIFFLLTFLPCVNIVISIMTIGKLAKVFGKGGGFALGLFFFGPIFMLILAFGNAVYIGMPDTYAQNSQPSYQPQQNYQAQPQYQSQPQYQPQQYFQPQSQYQPTPQSSGTKYCSACGAQLGNGEFCPSCGTKVQKTPAIPSGSWQCSCGRVNSGEFCPVCGAKKG